MAVSVPEGGLVLKVRDADHAMIGTLNLSQDGVQFIQSNAKKQPDRHLPWETFHNLMVSGLLG